MSGMLILAMPGIVLATGFFLLLNNTIGLPQSADGIVIFTNALMAIPYELKVLENPMRDITARYSMLCQSLGIEGWSRLKVVELRALKRPLAQALAFACRPQQAAHNPSPAAVRIAIDARPAQWRVLKCRGGLPPAAAIACAGQG
jgi:ABC-type uncharacterized transport system YnjBCD permease subunit